MSDDCCTPLIPQPGAPGTPGTPGLGLPLSTSIQSVSSPAIAPMSMAVSVLASPLAPPGARSVIFVITEASNAYLKGTFPLLATFTTAATPFNSSTYKLEWTNASALPVGPNDFAIDVTAHWY